MKIFLAGATGALGRQLLPRLAERGHAVTGTTRDEFKRQLIRKLGGRPVVVDALDKEAVVGAVVQDEPDVIVHQLTAIPRAPDMRRFARDFEQTNRLRTLGTDHLLAAGRAVGVRRFVAQSYAAGIFARVGSAVKDEDDPLDANAPEQVRPTIAAIEHLEEAVTGAGDIDGVALRYGYFYGPGTTISLGPEGTLVQAVRKRQLPLVGDATGVWPFVHIHDAADATVRAIEGHGDGIYNVVDDEPAAVADWLPAMADAVGARSPWRVPRWLGRLVAGEFATVMMTEARGASNARAKRELSWVPRHTSWRQGFVTGLG
jgi:nucleoside-diphosphate-sugar epimerase